MTDIVSVLRTWPAGERVNVNVMREAADEIERLVAQVASDDEHYRAAMAMSEKHRKLWVEASQSLAAIANSMKHEWIDPAEHANWCIERAKREQRGD